MSRFPLTFNSPFTENLLVSLRISNPYVLAITMVETPSPYAGVRLWH